MSEREPCFPSLRHVRHVPEARCWIVSVEIASGCWSTYVTFREPAASSQERP